MANRKFLLPEKLRSLKCIQSHTKLLQFIDDGSCTNVDSLEEREKWP